ncbi:MAG: LuxR C-terminal-related transcriptional regulator [Anaerolineae bacterium]
MVVPILTTKLNIPLVRFDPSTPLKTKLVSRPRLIDRLNAGLHCKLTLVSAPAGFGKTTLLSEWASNCDRPVAWVSLDPGDNDPVRFWAYFVTALQTIDTTVGESVLAALQSNRIPTADAPPIEVLLTGLINEISEMAGPPVTGPLRQAQDDASTGPSTSLGGTSGRRSGRSFALVLDDYHLITDQRIHDAVVFLLDNLPPQAHLILASRSDPPWPLARMRVRGEMTEIRANNLRFTPAEAATFLNDVAGLGLSVEDVATLDARTEGWITGLQLAALSMQGRRDVTAFIQALSGSHRFILDYLVEEVLDRQSDDVQEFLLMTSVLDRMTAPLCDAVTGRDDGHAILQKLEQANLFLMLLDDERRWYRYHHLFADLLRSRLEQSLPGQAPVLHRRASDWYEQHGLIAEAVGHALAGGDVDRVARLVERNALATIYHGRLATLVSWLDALPDEVVRSRPWLSVAYAWALAGAGHFEAVERRLLDVERALDRSRLDTSAGSTSSEQESAVKPRQSEIEGHLLALRAYTSAIRADILHASDLARAALACLPKEDPTVRGFTTLLLGSLLRWSGDFEGATRIWSDAIATSAAANDTHAAVITRSTLAALQIERGQLHAAAETCREALGLAREYARQRGRQLAVIAPTYARMSTILREWNDLAGALDHAREALKLSRQGGQAESLTTAYGTLAEALQASGDAAGALNAVREASQIARSLSPWYGAQVAAQQAQLSLEQGNLAAALRWAKASDLDVDDDPSFLGYEGHLTLARVLIAQAQRKPEGSGAPKRSLSEALGLLTRLLRMAETAGAMGRVIETLALQATALRAQGEDDQALAALERALSVAEPEGYVRTFITEGRPMADLLRQAAARGIRSDYVSRLLEAFRLEDERQRPDFLPEVAEGLQVKGPSVQRTSLPSSPLVEPLSERELEVLRFLTSHLSTTEIAEHLYISTHTVRSHVKNIYSKLGVHSRLEAVARARELNLL